MNFFKILLLAVLFLISSCEFLTPKLWKKSYYHDDVEQFLISQEGKNIIFIGTNYHYIFSNNSNIQKMLKEKNTSKLKMVIGDFEIKSNNKIEGDIKFIISQHDIGNKNRTIVKDLGLKRSKYRHHYHEYVKNIHLTGTRYLPKKGIDCINAR